jgi:small redox-active disulfide protein 2
VRTVQILGTGCAKCKKLAENAEGAIKELGGEYQVEKITDIQKITSFGVMMTPALAVDGKVKSVGKVLSEAEIRTILVS